MNKVHDCEKGFYQHLHVMVSSDCSRLPLKPLLRLQSVATKPVNSPDRRSKKLARKALRPFAAAWF